MKWLTDILTDDTGLNFTPDKVAWLAVVATFIGATVWAICLNKQPMNWSDFGIGAGAILAGGGGATWLSSRQKPTPPEGSETVK